MQAMWTYSNDRKSLFQGLSVCPEDESIILSSIYNTIAGLSIKQGKGQWLFDQMSDQRLVHCG